MLEEDGDLEGEPEETRDERHLERLSLADALLGHRERPARVHNALADRAQVGAAIDHAALLGRPRPPGADVNARVTLQPRVSRACSVW